MEKIRAAAIKYHLKEDPTTDQYVFGPNHAYCIEWFSCAGIYANQRQDEIQGFITTYNRFVDRFEAYQIAKRAGQLIKECDSERLDSYNVNMSE